jgi:50S ribosomal subunit-associated GTPase HflX
MITDTRPLIEINQQAINLLYKELGVIDAVRFLKQFTQGYGNYTQEREEMFVNKSLDEIVSEIEKRRKTNQSRKSSRAHASTFRLALFP